MLHRESVQTFLINAIEKLTTMDVLNDFRLVGGTALALQIGHRQSIDIDLFSDKFKTDYPFQDYYSEVKKAFGEKFSFSDKSINSTGFSFYLADKNGNENKVDIYKWPNPFLFPPIIEEGIRMATLDDIIAMKLEAIEDRNNYRDYVDIAFLSERYTLSEMIALYKKRSLKSDVTGIVKALSNPNDLVRDQKLIFIQPTTEKELKEKIDYLLFVYIKEEEQKLKNKLK